MEENVINLFIKNNVKLKCISVFLDHVIDNGYIVINKVFLGKKSLR